MTQGTEQSLASQNAALRLRLKQAEANAHQTAGLFTTVVEQAPMGVYVVDDQFRLQQINARALPAFARVDPLIGRDFVEVMGVLWGGELGGKIADIFRHTLNTGEPYISPRFSEFRQDLQEERAYDWETQRVTLPDGRFGVVCYFNDTTERVQAESALREAKAAAEEANRSKDAFLAALSHELRTPLMPVLLSADSLREDPRLPHDVRDQLHMIERNIALEARLLDDLFDITAVTQGKLQLRPEPFDAHSLIALSCRIVRDEAAAKHITITTECAAQRSGLVADPARFQQVIWNLLRNAVKFTPSHGHIKVLTHDYVAVDGEISLRVQVTDTGIGIEPNALDKIFRPFEQAAATGNHRFGGLGLGLAIAQAIVHLHRGLIWAESPGLNQGATFTVEFPYSTPPPQGLSDVNGSAAAAHGSSYASTGPTDSLRRLLLVEDHAPTLQVITTLLTRAEYKVVAVNTVAAALAAAAHETFDLVISDLGLPDGSGVEMMRVLRDRHGLRGVALSGYGTDEDLQRTREAGFVMHLVKPIRIGDLRRVLNELAQGSA